MTCEVCGGELHMQDQDGGIEEGWFIEHYKCASCGAKGHVRGKAEQSPSEWCKHGTAFEGAQKKRRSSSQRLYDKTYTGRQCKSMDAQKNRHRIINNDRV